MKPRIKRPSSRLRQETNFFDLIKDYTSFVDVAREEVFE